MPSVIQRSYTAEEKERAIATVFMLGSINGASRHLNIPYTTLRQWVKAKPDVELAEMRQAIRDKVVEEGWSVIQNCLDRAATLSEAGGVGLKDLIEIAERSSRILKNIGEVSERHEVIGRVDHVHTIPLEERINDYANRIERELEGRRKALCDSGRDN